MNPGHRSDVAAADLTHAEKRRILVVEDNDDARSMLRAILELAGHEVIERADGPSGLEAAVNLRPDAALVDVGLPGLNGYDVARQIRARLSGQPMRLIALTGYGQPQNRTQALEAGFDAHLVKPVEPESLLRIVTSAPKSTSPVRGAARHTERRIASALLRSSLAASTRMVSSCSSPIGLTRWWRNPAALLRLWSEPFHSHSSLSRK